MSRRILLLEDDEDIRELFTLVLQEHGFEIHLYDQVFENLEEVERLSPTSCMLMSSSEAHKRGRNVFTASKRTLLLHTSHPSYALPQS